MPIPPATPPQYQYQFTPHITYRMRPHTPYNAIPIYNTCQPASRRRYTNNNSLQDKKQAE